MDKKPRKIKVPSFMRAVLSKNLQKLMDRHYKESTNKHLDVAKAANVSLSTIQRIMNGETGATIDVLASLAGVFNVTPYQLLIPNLNVFNPQVASEATEAEQRMFAEWRKNAKKEVVVEIKDK